MSTPKPVASKDHLRSEYIIAQFGPPWVAIDEPRAVANAALLLPATLVQKLSLK